MTLVESTKANPYKGLTLNIKADKVSPESQAYKAKAGRWLIAGLKILGEVHKKMAMPAKKLDDLIAKKLASADFDGVVSYPMGTAANPFQKVYTAKVCREFTLHTLDGNVTYVVVRQPGKYVATREPYGKYTKRLCVEPYDHNKHGFDCETMIADGYLCELKD